VVNVGVNHHVNVGNTHMTTVGALPGGSGGGGGGDVTYNGAFNWLVGDPNKPDIKANVGKSLQLTYGEQVAAVGGLSTRCVVGCQTDVVINPLAITGLLPLPTTFQAVAVPLAGECHFRLGALSNITYGQTLTMNRGPQIKLTGPPSTLTLALAGAAAVLGTASVLTAGGLDPDTKAGEITDLSLGGGFGTALAALIASEVRDSFKELTKLTTAEATDAKAAKNLKAMKAATDDLETTADFAAEDITKLSNTLARIQNVLEVKDNNYALQANTIYENGRSGTLLTAGAGNTECLVSLDPNAPPLGQGILLGYGDPVAQPVMQMNNQGVTISAGAPNTGPRITLSPNPTQGLTLAYGPPDTGYSITLNTRGITLTVGAATVLELTPATFKLTVPTFDVQTEGQFTIFAQNLVENVTGIVTRKAGVDVLV
jgi:hypothetical protein